MELKTYRESFPIRTCDCDFMGEWRPSAILTAMQEIAGMHSHLLGCGREVLMRNNLVWVLTRSEVRMQKYPRVGDTVKLETFPAPIRRWFFPRYYLFRNQDGETLGCAATLWVLMDFQERKMAPPGNVAKSLPDNSDLQPPMGMPGAAEIPENGAETAIKRLPAYFDLDVNLHVNNTRYADWACDMLGVDLMRDHRLESMRINYEAEIRPENEMELHLIRRDDRFYLSGVHEGVRHFEMDGVLEKR